MPEPSPTVDQSGLDRRRFLGGVWRADPADTAADTLDRAARPEAGIRVLVQAAPARLDAVADAIAAIPGIRLLRRDPPGRLTTAVPADAVAGMLGALAAVPGVLTASVMAASARETIP